MSSADLAGRSAKERREGLVAVNDQARVREGDRAIFHLLDQQAVGAVGTRNGVNMLAERPTHDDRVDFPAANDFERFLRLAKLGTQFLTSASGSRIKPASAIRRLSVTRLPRRARPRR